MAVESDADRLIFLNPDEFGVTVDFGGGEKSGLFDAAYFAVELGVPVPAEGARCRLLCRDMDLPGGELHGAPVAITGGSIPAAWFADYTIREVQPDATGMTALVVERD